MEGLWGFGLCMWVCVSFALPFLLERFSLDPNTISLGNESGIVECGKACYW